LRRRASVHAFVLQCGKYCRVRNLLQIVLLYFSIKKCRQECSKERNVKEQKAVLRFVKTLFSFSLFASTFSPTTRCQNVSRAWVLRKMQRARTFRNFLPFKNVQLRMSNYARASCARKSSSDHRVFAFFVTLRRLPAHLWSTLLRPLFHAHFYGIKQFCINLTIFSIKKYLYYRKKRKLQVL